VDFDSRRRAAQADATRLTTIAQLAMAFVSAMVVFDPVVTVANVVAVAMAAGQMLEKEQLEHQP
jgi:hypothetical protein